MPRLMTRPLTDVPDKVIQLLAAIKSATGMVPNVYADMGNISPLALETSLRLDAALNASSLTKQETETIKLAVSEAAGCDYCVAAHVAIGMKTGLSRASLQAMRRGLPSGDDRLDALATFVRALVTTRGTLSADQIGAVRQAGYSDPQIVEALLAVTSITLTNLFNRVNDTALDFPAAG
ncbi:MAG TPA: carboxymuconolactone decarboxylase family protein [Noviherbaspirillum sp.]